MPQLTYGFQEREMALVRSPRWGRFFVIESRFFVIEKRDCQLRPPLRCRRAAIEKLANGCDKLGWRERLGQKEAVRDAMRGPLVGTGTGHVDDGNRSLWHAWRLPIRPFCPAV